MSLKRKCPHCGNLIPSEPKCKKCNDTGLCSKIEGHHNGNVTTWSSVRCGCGALPSLWHS